MVGDLCAQLLVDGEPGQRLREAREVLRHLRQQAERVRSLCSSKWPLVDGYVQGAAGVQAFQSLRQFPQKAVSCVE